MTKKRDNKTKKRNVPDLSDTISIDGSTALHGFTARGRTHLGGQPYGIVFQQGNKSTSHRSTSIGQPVTGQPVIQSSVNQHQSTRHRAPVIQIPVNIYQSLVSKYGIPGTGHFITCQHSTIIQSPVLGLQSSYPASISSHHSRSSERRLPSNDNMGSGHSFAHELPNPATSSRMILPLEPDFSQMSAPSVIVEPPNT